MYVNQLPCGRLGRSVSPWISVFSAVVSILVMVAVSVRHIAFVLLSETYFVGCVLFTISSRGVISVIYCPLALILLFLFHLLSNPCLTF